MHYSYLQVYFSESPKQNYIHICQNVLVPFRQVCTSPYNSAFLAAVWLKFR